jgi:hypothetical protein
VLRIWVSDNFLVFVVGEGGGGFLDPGQRANLFCVQISERWCRGRERRGFLKIGDGMVVVNRRDGMLGSFKTKRCPRCIGLSAGADLPRKNEDDT